MHVIEVVKDILVSLLIHVHLKALLYEVQFRGNTHDKLCG